MNKKNDFPFHFPFRVRYSEVDAQGVVFNAHYLTFFDTAVTEYLRWRGLHLTEDIASTGFDFHTVKSVVEYRAPLHFDDEIEVYVRLGKHGRSSLNWELAIYRQNEDQLLTTGEVIWVYVNMTSHKATRISQDLINKLAA